MRTLLTLILFCAIESLPPADALVATCYPPLINGEAHLSSADSVEWYDDRGTLFAGAGYDMRVGRFFEYSTHWDFRPQVFARDTYRIEGASSGDSIPIHVELRVDMSGEDTGVYDPVCLHCSMHVVYFTLMILDSYGEADSASFCICGETTNSVGLDLRVLPDEDFRMDYNVRFFPYPANQRARADASIRFTGIPPGAQLTSCLGVEQAVPTKGSTWGAVKARYR